MAGVSSSGKGEQHVLYTIPFSHFCEAARWALTLAGVEFVEAAYLPGVHAFFSPVEKLRNRGGTPPSGFTGSNSSVPLLVNATKDIIAFDAWQCMAKYGEMSMPEAKETLDTVVGPCVRSIYYSHTLTSEGDGAFVKMCCHPRVPTYQRWLMSASPFRNKVKSVMRERMVISEEHIQECRAKLRDALKSFEAVIGEAPYTGEEATVPGIALASLLAPLVNPPEYGVSFYRSTLIELEDIPQSLRDEVNDWRSTPVGKWTLDYYRMHRRKAGGAK